MTIKPLNKISSTVAPSPDKSITHRAIILASLAKGKSTIYNYLDSDDCRRTIDAFVSMGVRIDKYADKLIIEGKGPDGLGPPASPINAGNSGTTMRLISGVIAGQNFSAQITGDSSLSKRPMRRIIEPLRKMRVEIDAYNDQYPPLKIRGNPNLKSITYKLPVPSAQVKSCVMLAGMRAKGLTAIKQPVISRDHTERMLEYFGIKVGVDNSTVSIEGPVSFEGKEIKIPGDFSSAAFFIVLGLLLPESKIKIENTGLNPTRTGLLDTLTRMGANIKVERTELLNNEPCGDLVVQSSKLKGITLDDPQAITSMIDEIPVLCLAATQAEGKTVIRNLRELRVKESDRIKSISDELNKMRAKVTELEDGLIIEGPVKLKGATLESYDDHRIAMMLSIAALLAEGETVISNTDCVSISFPDFFKILDEFQAISR
jgi:3-phosphoshikimate 1-carboxyvinyltransferase